MPYSPPGCDDYHSAVIGPYVGIEDCWVEEEDKTKSRVLDACFYGDGFAVGIWHFEDGACSVTDAKCEEVVSKDYEEYISDAFHECVHVVAEGEDYHCDEECDGEVLHWLFECPCKFWKILCTKAAEEQRYAKEYDYCLEDFPKGDVEFGKDHSFFGEVKIHITPEGEVERGCEYACCCVECCE